MRKKRILWHSDGAQNPTGFGAVTKYILSYLYRTGKYEIANYACGCASNSPDINKFPWKTYPTLPIERADLVSRANQDPGFRQILAYGEPLLEQVVSDFRPDVYIGVQDWWGAPDFAIEKQFWNKISCVAWWTADSVPILDFAVQKAERVENHYVWASFAEKEYRNLADRLEKQLPSLPEDQKEAARKKIAGWKRVKTLSGCVNEHNFYRLPENTRQELRLKFGLAQDLFLIGTGSRNQLRKAFGIQIHAFSLFKKNNPGVKAKLLHWTSTDEGWNLVKHCEEYGVDINDVLCAHRCRKTGEIFYFPATSGEKDNPKIPEKKTVTSVGMGNFAPEKDINEYLNVLDVFMLNITSGGFELWLSQAKLTEIPTIANGYSCFEEQVGEDKGCLEAEQSFYYEIGTGFKKSTPSPSSIYKKIDKVFKMDAKKRREIGKAGRQFVLENYAIDVIGKQWEELIDSLPLTNYNFEPEKVSSNPEVPVPHIEENADWIKALYKNILGRDPDEGGFAHWMNAIAQGMPRANIEGYFRQVAKQELSKGEQSNPLDKVLGPEAPENRVLITMPESVGDVLYLTALLKDARVQYADKVIYVATKPPFMEILTPLIGEFIDGVIEWHPFMDNALYIEGYNGNKKYFQVVLLAHWPTQRNLNYKNCADKTSFDLTLK